MEDNNILPKTQFGFRTGMSTINAVENLVQNIQKAKREKETVGVIFVDVSKAFDCCDHKIILNKLRTIGLDTKGVKLFESYLSNRIQSVLYNQFCGAGLFFADSGFFRRRRFFSPTPAQKKTS